MAVQAGQQVVWVEGSRGAEDEGSGAEGQCSLVWERGRQVAKGHSEHLGWQMGQALLSWSVVMSQQTC